MKNTVKDAAVGLSFAGVGIFAVRVFGFTQYTLMLLLYTVVAVSVFQGLRYSERSFIPDFLNRIVVVIEGEELKLKRVLSGEKYKIKGELEKL